MFSVSIELGEFGTSVGSIGEFSEGNKSNEGSFLLDALGKGFLGVALRFD